MDWNRYDDGFHHFLVLPGTEEQTKQNLFTLILYRFQKWDAVTAFAVRDATGPKLMSIDMDDTWDSKKGWHQIAFAWDAKSSALYVDGKAPVVQECSGPASTAFAGSEFQIGGPYFITNATQTAVDELSIYGGKLTTDEIRNLFLAGVKGQ